MLQQPTDSIRIDKELLDRIRHIAKTRGQTISGYINLNLSKIVHRHWIKIDSDFEKPKKGSI